MPMLHLRLDGVLTFNAIARFMPIILVRLHVSVFRALNRRLYVLFDGTVGDKVVVLKHGLQHPLLLGRLLALSSFVLYRVQRLIVMSAEQTIQSVSY